MSNHRPWNFSIIGRSGSGKGTQAELLLKYLAGDYIYISTGDLLRELVKERTEISQKVKKILDEGGLVYPDLLPALWLHKLAYNLTADRGFVFDGAPRSLIEAELFVRFLDFVGRRKTTRVLLIDVSRREAFKRLKLRAREDDKDQEINSRLDFFDRDVVPALNYFEKEGLVLKINGEGSVEEIHQELITKVNGSLKDAK